MSASTWELCSSPGVDLSVWDRADTPVLRFQGADAVDFLHRMVTQDVARLRPGGGAPLCFTDRMGKVQGSGVLYRDAEGLDLVSDPACLQAFSGKLSMYVLSSQVTVSRVEDRALMGLVGPGARGHLERLGLPLPGDEPWAHAAAEVDGLMVKVRRVDDLGVPAFDLELPIGAALRERLVEGLPTLSASDETLLRVTAGRALFGVDYGDEALPTEVGREDSVSYSKGCYVGQEILERLRSRGVRTKALRALVLEGPPPDPGAIVSSLEGEELGALSSPVAMPDGARSLGLAVLSVKKVDPGVEVRVGERQAVVRALPLEV